MNGKEKIYFLIDAIDEARTITPSGQPLIIDPVNDLNRNYRDIELKQLFTKLEKDEQVLKVLKVPRRIKEIDLIEELDPYEHADDGCWHIELLPAFDRYYLKIQYEPEYQEFTGKKPAGITTKPSNGSLMTYEQKLELIVKAVIEARKATRKGQTTIVYLNATNGLDQLDSEEIRNILLQLQDENAIKVNPKTNRILPLHQQPANPGYYLLDILDGFDNWYENYFMQQKTSLKNLDYINMLRIYDVVLDINEQIQLTHKTTVYFPLIPSFIRYRALFPADTIGLRNEYCQNRLNSLIYLKEKGAIADFSQNAQNWDTTVTVSLILSKFDDFYKTMMAEYVKHNKAIPAQLQDKKIDSKATAQIQQDQSKIIYKITFTTAREILLNGFQIAKPDFDSENEVVFSFLFKHPNKRHTLKDIETATGRKLTKTLHKVIENLGFTGDIKKVFIDVNKDSVCLRNPITQDDLDKLGIKQIKFNIKAKTAE